ncbi:DUF1799 domain-containing protein [Rheinheimera sp.]|uniref:DUF1799 domain-containing protein n=1 Tax=Rheinheimera sp. TaxID=1869214 RepID=UPI00307D5006
MQQLGAPQDLIDRTLAKENGMPDIQPANHITVRLFFACATQWLYAGMAGVRTGLNYQAVDVRASKLPEYVGLDLESQEWVWDGLQRMESAALTVWQDKD